MKINNLFLMIFLVMGSIGSVKAQSLYKWVDSSGKVHYSTSVPPDAVTGKYEKFKPTSSKKEVSPAQLSKEEAVIAEKEMEIKKIKAEEEKEKASKRKALVDRYRSDKDFDDLISAAKKEYASITEVVKKEQDTLEEKLNAQISSKTPNRLEIAKLRSEIEEKKTFIDKRRDELNVKIVKIQSEKTEWQEAIKVNK